jgi:hypothetical protein
MLNNNSEVILLNVVAVAKRAKPMTTTASLVVAEHGQPKHSECNTELHLEHGLVGTITISYRVVHEHRAAERHNSAR